jgi:dCMP deaminase
MPVEEYKSTDKWDDIFLIISYAMDSASHCRSYKVGAIIVKDRRIISTGINGTAEGCTNCDDIFPEKTSPEFNRKEHHDFSTANEIHAEMNALLFKAKNGIGGDLNGATLYCTTQPCNECIKNIIQSGIKRIVYSDSYNFSAYSDFIMEAIKNNKIELVQRQVKKTSNAFMFLTESLK